MDVHDYPILEFDADHAAIIDPARIHKKPEMPKRAVACFFKDVIDTLIEKYDAEKILEMGSEIGKNPIYKIEVNGEPIAVFHPGVGAPLAAGFLEHAIALGATKIIACGGAGVLHKSIALGHLIIPTSALRDEGTSYHYLPPSREVQGDQTSIDAIIATMEKHRAPYTLAKTWTTDAFFRETPERVNRRRNEGCVTVEMETAAFFAVAQFRNVHFGQILYGGDDISGDEWDKRDWNNQMSVREKVFWLAAEACVAIADS